MSNLTDMPFGASTMQGGQVPLLKHHIMKYLLEHRRGDKGHVAADINSYTFVDVTKASPSAVSRAMWDLQGNGLITFRESKRSGTDGHSSTTVLDRLNITPKGLEWKVEPAAYGDIGVKDIQEDDWNPAFKNETMAERIAGDMLDEHREALITEIRGMAPAMALYTLLRARGQAIKVKTLNSLMGYDATSTAIYSVVRSNPEAFHIDKAYVHLDAPEGWRPTYKQSAPRHEARGVTMLHGKPLAKMGEGRTLGSDRPLVAADTPPTPEPVPAEPKVQPVLPPLIAALLKREGQREKVLEASAALEAAGLEEDAITVLGRIPDDTPLEAEVVAYFKSLEWE